MKHRALLRASALFATAALMLAACATDETDNDATTDPDPQDSSDNGDPQEPSEDNDLQDEEADDEAMGTVTLLTHDSFNISESVLEDFTAETGIEVQLAPSGDAGEALNQAILTADAPQGDLLFGVDNTFLSRALDEDLFTAYESPELEHVPDELVLDPEFRATPVTVGDVCLNYDTAVFDDDSVPTELADLTDPAFEGELAVMNPATSSPGLAFLLATIAEFGEDGYLDFWQDLVDNDVLVVPGWSEGYYDEFSGVSEGDRSLIVSYATSPPQRFSSLRKRISKRQPVPSTRLASVRLSSSESSQALTTRTRPSSSWTSCCLTSSRTICR